MTRSPSVLRQAGTSETRAQRDPVSLLKYMGILNPSRRERGAGGKRRWAFGDRSRAVGQSPKGGWSLQTPLAHKEKGPARDLFSGLQCANGGAEGIRTRETVLAIARGRFARHLSYRDLVLALERLLPFTKRAGTTIEAVTVRRKSVAQGTPSGIQSSAGGAERDIRESWIQSIGQYSLLIAYATITEG